MDSTRVTTLLADVSVFNLANLLSLFILIFVFRFMLCSGGERPKK